MTPKYSSPIYFQDAQAHQQGFAVIRSADGVVGITLSLEDDGDIEVFLPVTAGEEVLVALQQAVAAAKGATLAA